MVQEEQSVSAVKMLANAVWSYLSGDSEDIGDMFKQELDDTCKQLAGEMGLTSRQEGELHCSLAYMGPREANKRYSGLIKGKGSIPFDAEVLIQLNEKLQAERDALGHPDSGTAETKKHRLTCPIFDLFNKGEIDSGHYRAAFQIERAWHFRTSGVAPRTSKYGDRISGGHNVEDDTAYEIVLQQTYMDWLEMLRTNGIKEGLVLDVIVHGERFRSSEKLNKCRNGTARSAVIEALSLYLKAKRKTDEWVRSMIDRHRLGAA